MDENELQGISRKAHLSNLKDKELPMFEKDLVSVRERIALLKEAFEADDAAWNIRKQKFRVNDGHASWEYELDPEYLKHLLHIQECNWKMKQYDREATLKPLLDNEKAMVEQMESITKEIERLELEMKK